MAQNWTSLQINGSEQITVPSSFAGQSLSVTLRTDKGGELTYLEGDVNTIHVQVRNFTILPFSGQTGTISQIMGGTPGTQLLLRPATVGHEITIENSANLFIPSGTIVLSAVSHVVMLVWIGTDTYAKLLL